MAFVHLPILSFTRLMAVLTFITLFPSYSRSDECQPWQWDSLKRRDATRSYAQPRPTWTPSVPRGIVPKTGEVNCRGWGRTFKNVNYYSCKKLADDASISVETFFLINPILHKDCGNIKPYHLYCTKGFIQPKRAYDGLCGPGHGNATCYATDNECCNSETWTCGSSSEDCAPGTCYEGICPGHKIYTTDGKCGRDHGNRMCAGKWGECCNMSGECGSGPDFCSAGSCQAGACTNTSMIMPDSEASPPWLSGNTTDGTCGGPQRYTCNVVYGNCCNKNGFCGSLRGDCGQGCQPEFGNCDVVE